MDSPRLSNTEKTLVSTAHDCGPINATCINRLLTICAAKIFYSSRKFNASTCGLPFGKVVKFHKGATLAEAHTVQFIARNTIIPVPKIYCAFTREKTGVTCIVQQKLPGKRISVEWRWLSEDSKAKVLGHLKMLIDSMRSLEPPPGTGVHNLCGGPFRDVKVVWTAPFGPFATVEKFHNWLRCYWNYDWDESEHQNDPTMLAVIKVQKMHRSKATWPLNFTHADLDYGNILIEGDRVTGIVDWESSGWYPYYWEWARATIDTESGVDGGHLLPEYVKQFLQPFSEEGDAEFERSIIFQQ